MGLQGTGAHYLHRYYYRQVDPRLELPVQAVPSAPIGSGPDPARARPPDQQISMVFGSDETTTTRAIETDPLMLLVLNNVRLACLAFHPPFSELAPVIDSSGQPSFACLNWARFQRKPPGVLAWGYAEPTLTSTAVAQNASQRSR